MCGLVVGVLAARAEAATISVIPNTQTVPQGATDVTVSIVVSGLGADAVGGVALDLDFGPQLLGTAFTLDPQGKMGAEFELPGFESGFSGGQGGSFHLEYYAGGDLVVPAQGDGFILATLTFTAAASGLSPLTLLGAPGGPLSDFAGGNIIQSALVNGEVCVGTAPCGPAVPEPATLSLLGLGAIALVARRRQRRR